MIIPGDPAPLVKTALAAFLGTGGRVVRDVPNTFDFQSAIPLILVADDGGPLEWPVLSRNTVRITVFANGLTAARAVAGRCAGFLHDNTPTGISHIFRNGSTLVEARDPKTGADMASFTVVATVRTTTV